MKYIEDSFILNYTERFWANIVSLSEETMQYLWEEIKQAEQNQVSHKSNLAGNISSSLLLFDNNKFMSEKLIPEIVETQYDYYQEKIQKDLNNPDLSGYWVNFQKKHEFNPIHNHGGVISFVIWMKIPYSWEDEIKIDIVKDSNTKNNIGNFVFVYPKDHYIHTNEITMNPQMEGRMAIFPSYFNHMVYPFYTSDESRISISGNVEFM
jgi:hypothetical protein